MTGSPIPAQEALHTVNLHPHSFEKILEICSGLGEQEEMREMIESLDLLEKNIRYLRQRLEGKLARALLRKQEQQRAEREQLKSSLRVLTGDKEAGGREGTRS